MTVQAEGPLNERVTTGVPGLDTVLQGGLLKSGVYMIRGTPGAGKTTLASQICFHHVGSGERALYVTLLSELHARLLQHLGSFQFFDESCVPDRFSLLSGFHALATEGVSGVIALLSREMRSFNTTMLVLDGLSNLDDGANSTHEIKKFIHELQSYAIAMDCTVLLVTTGSRQLTSPEYTMVDGVLELDVEQFVARSEHVLQVRKSRGSSFLSGKHFFRITGEGLCVYPRLEAVHRFPERRITNLAKRLSIGLPVLDNMMRGGLPEASTTLVLGPAGIGKTTLGLHFIAQATAEEPALLFGFYERPDEILHKASALKIDLASGMQAGAIDMIWQPPTEQLLDDLGHALLDAVRRRQVKRLFIDGLGGFEHTALYKERIGAFFTALSNELRARGVTTIFTWEQRDLVGPEIKAPISAVSVLMQNLILLRYFEHQSDLRRFVSILKMRDSGFDSSIREFQMTDIGFRVAESIESAEALLSGYPQIRQRGERNSLRGVAG